MARKMLPYASLFVLLALLLSPVPHTEQTTAKYLLIRKHPVFFDQDDTPSAALLITDPDEIRKVRDLATTIVYTGHTCGFDWSLTFWENPSEAADSFSINESCDRYDPQFKPYFQQLKDRPTHAILNLRIPVQVHPERAIADLEERSLTALLPHGSNPHLPQVWVSVPSAEKTRLRPIVDAIAENYAVKILDVRPCPDSRNHGDLDCPAYATIWFEQGTNLTGITDRVESLGASVLGKEIPYLFYDVWLVVEKQDLEQVKQKVSGELDYVAGISKYNPLSPLRSTPADTAASEPSAEWITSCVDCPKQFYWMTDRSLGLDSAGHPHMAYGKDHLYYAWHDGVSWHYETADHAPGVGMSASLALDGNEHPHISYYDEVNDDLKYAYKDASVWHIETVDSLGEVGEYTSIAVDPAGLPHISYCDGTNKNLKYAYKDVSGWHIETVNDKSGTAWYTSLALDRAGYPHIGYYNGMAVQYAYQDGAGWHVEAVEMPVSRGGNLSLALDSAGLAHITYDSDRPDDALKHAYRDASGWHIEAIDSAGEGGEFISLVLDRDGHPHVSYHNLDNGPLKYAFRDASGWHVETVDSERGELRSTSLALDDAGRAHIGYHAWSQAALKYARRDDSGWHIESMDSEGDLGKDTSLVVDELGYPHISYKYADYQGTNLKYAYEDAGGWHAQTVDSTRYAGGDCSLALDDNGYAHISYYQGGDRALRYAYQDDLGWHVETVDNGEYVGTDSALALDSAGFPHISYCDRGLNALKYAFKDTSGWHLETVDSEGDVGWSTSLALDGYGFAHISYLDWGNSELKYAYRDASGWHIQAVDADVEEDTSLALDSHGNLHISYYGRRVVKYAYQDGAGWHIEVAAELGEPGWSISLALDSDGNPHISYNDRTGFDLRYAYRDASGWHIKTVDAEGDVGAFASLALDGSGKAAISYYDWTNGDLKYASQEGAVRPAAPLYGGPDTIAEPEPVPTSELPAPVSQDYTDLGCIYVGDPIVLDGELWGSYGIGAKLSSDQHAATMAEGKICWFRGEDLPQHLPFPLPTPQEAIATPAEVSPEVLACDELVTPDTIGQGDFGQFGIAEKLEQGLFQREVSQAQVSCWYQRKIDEAFVEGDHLYYQFDLGTSALLKKQVWWRADLTEQLPSPLITREEAEAMVEGEAQHSMLVIIHPDTAMFQELNSTPEDTDTTLTTRPTTENPCWIVYGGPGQASSDGATGITVIDAVTGKILGYTEMEP